MRCDSVLILVALGRPGVRHRRDGGVGSERNLVAAPGAIHVSVHHGAASLRGPVLPGERDRVLTMVLDVPGVLQVTNLLEPVEPAGSLPT